MIIDFLAKPRTALLMARRWGNKVFVDGIEIKLVFYVDTEAGIVKTYDVFRNGLIRSTAGRELLSELLKVYTPSDFPGREVECPKNGVMSETLRGKVEIRK